MAQDPKSRAGSVVARKLSSSSAINIAALLDKVLDMQAVAAAQSDEQKEKHRIVSELLGGDSLNAEKEIPESRTGPDRWRSHPFELHATLTTPT